MVYKPSLTPENEILIICLLLSENECWLRIREQRQPGGRQCFVEEANLSVFLLSVLSPAKGPRIPRRTCYTGLLRLREERELGCKLPFTTELRWRLKGDVVVLIYPAPHFFSLNWSYWEKNKDFKKIYIHRQSYFFDFFFCLFFCFPWQLHQLFMTHWMTPIICFLEGEPIRFAPFWRIK